MYALTKIEPPQPPSPFMSVRQARTENVEKCIDLYCGGVVSQFARLVGKQHSQIWRCLQRRKVRNQPRWFGEKLCMQCETALGLPMHSLSMPPHQFAEWAERPENMETVAAKISPGQPIWFKGVLISVR